MESDDVANLYNLRPVYFTYKEGIVDLDDEDKGKIEPGFTPNLSKNIFHLLWYIMIKVKFRIGM